MTENNQEYRSQFEAQRVRRVKFAQVNAERVQAGHEPMGWGEFVQQENYFARMRRISQGWARKS
jgi:hypothetical protein